MSFEAIEQEIVGWDDAKLRKLQALVVSLRLRHDDPGFSENRSAWLRRLAELRGRTRPTGSTIQQLMDDLRA
jgi:hypothetical protein